MNDNHGGYFFLDSEDRYHQCDIHGKEIGGKEDEKTD